jgi:hypothetical protein
MSVMKVATAPNSATWAHDPSGLRAVLIELRRAITKDLFDAYRPEKHYMRGPGPKWRERHMSSDTLDPGMLEAPSAF